MRRRQVPIENERYSGIFRRETPRASTAMVCRKRSLSRMRSPIARILRFVTNTNAHCLSRLPHHNQTGHKLSLFLGSFSECLRPRHIAPSACLYSSISSSGGRGALPPFESLLFERGCREEGIKRELTRACWKKTCWSVQVDVDDFRSERTGIRKAFAFTPYNLLAPHLICGLVNVGFRFPGALGTLGTHLSLWWP